MSTALIILLSFLGLNILVLIVYYLYFFNSLIKFEQLEAGTAELPPVSVIISARNEKKNLEKFLPLILDQDYPNFEVIVINDWSFDGTNELIEGLTETNKNLKLVKIEVDERFKRGKKFALTMGIKAASHERLLFTDADCYPTSKKWISSMMLANSDNKAIVIGNAPLLTRKSPLGALIKYETFHTALQYLTYAYKGKTYMGVGRNLSYTKTLFFENKGFATHQHILSGDDDLFIQETATKDNVAVCVHPDSFMYSSGPTKLGAWVKQKIRHLSTSPLYQGKYKRLLGLYSFAQIMFFVVAILGLLIFTSKWYFIVALISLKWAVQWAVIFKPSQILDAKFIGYFLPLYDVLYSFYLVIFGILKMFIKPKTWS